MRRVVYWRIDDRSFLLQEIDNISRSIASTESGDSAADPSDEPCQPALGRSPHSWRAPQARHRCRPDLRCEVHGAAKAPSIARLETFLLNHADGIASIDLFVVPTISFRLLYGLLVVRHDRRRILWLGVTAHPTAEWIAQQITEGCGWEEHASISSP